GEEHGDLQLVTDTAAERARELRAVVEGEVLDRDERNHVGRAHARVLAAVVVEVDEPGRALDDPEGRFDHGLWLAGAAQHPAVVVGVHLAVEERRARHGRDRLDQLVDDLAPATFGEVGNALDQSGHDGSSSLNRSRGSGSAPASARIWASTSAAIRRRCFTSRSGRIVARRSPGCATWIATPQLSTRTDRGSKARYSPAIVGTTSTSPPRVVIW